MNKPAWIHLTLSPFHSGCALTQVGSRRLGGGACLFSSDKISSAVVWLEFHFFQVVGIEVRSPAMFFLQVHPVSHSDLTSHTTGEFARHFEKLKNDARCEYIESLELTTLNKTGEDISLRGHSERREAVSTAR